MHNYCLEWEFTDYGLGSGGDSMDSPLDRSGALSQVHCSSYSARQGCRRIASVAGFLLREGTVLFVQVVSVFSVGEIAQG